MGNLAAIKAHTIRLDGAEQGFACTPGDILLRAALRAGVGFPYECNSGGCGSCMFELVSGEIDTIWPQAPGLSARSRERGRRLACQSRPQGDCVVRTRPRTDCVPQLPPARHRVRLERRTELTADMAEFSFRAGMPADFLPGQYALLDLPGVIGARAYSMSNLPNADGLWRFIVKRTPSGRGSAALFDALHSDDELMLDGPYGLAYLRPDRARDIVCIAGGSGLSPVISILSAAVREPRLRERKLILLYGGRTPADLCAPAVLARDAQVDARVECLVAISDDTHPGPWSGERGLIHDVAARWLGARDARAFDWYFCGPPPMTTAVHKMLMLERRVPTAQIHFDRFL